MAQRPYPDDREENGQQYSFQQFVNQAQRFYTRMQNEDLPPDEDALASKAFLQFMLAGRIRINDILRHITFNACQGLREPQYQITRDYDSLIGASKDLPYTIHLALSPVPPFRDILYKPNHIKGLAYNRVKSSMYSFQSIISSINNVLQDQPTLVSMHTIPNFAFGKVAARSVVRVFLPRMYGVNASNKVPSQDLQLIYDECLRPLVAQHMSNMATHWPVSYTSALTLYRDNKGRIYPGSLDIPAHILPIFGQDYLNRLAALRPSFRDAYFVHELRGWKGATIHDPSHEPDKAAALEDLLRCLDMDLVNQDEWQIDVAMELGVPGHVVTWRTSNHHQLLHHCLPTLNNEEVTNLMDRQAFILDPTMHLKDLSGFRCSPGAKGRHDHVFYIQAYTTEKTMAYQQHQGLFTEIEPKALLSTGSLDKLVKNMEKMSLVLYDCTGEQNENAEPQNACARIEVRVCLSDALDVLENFPLQHLRQSLAAIPSKDWWYLYLYYPLDWILSLFSGTSSGYGLLQCMR